MEDRTLIRLQLPRAAYPESFHWIQTFDQLIEGLRARPETSSVSAVSVLPWSGGSFQAPFLARVRGEPVEHEAEFRVIASDYFRTLGIRLHEGRDFEALRESGSQEVILSASLASRFWPEDPALGQEIRLGRADSEGPWLRVVGVVDDVREDPFADQVAGQLYVPFADFPQPRMFLVARKSPDRETDLQPVVRSVLRAADPDLAPDWMMTGEEMRSRALATHRFGLFSVAVLTVAAVLLSAAGIFGSAMQVVVRARRELAIRMALGSSPGSIVSWLLRRTSFPLLGGLLLGSLGVAATRSLLIAMFPRAGQDDFTLVALSILGLALVGLGALSLPLLRATTTDASTALRS